MRHGEKSMLLMEFDSNNVIHFSRSLMCPSTGISYPDPEPNLFSFNSPYGACPNCSGLGGVLEANIDKIIPDLKKSIKKGAIAPLGDFKGGWIYDKIENVLKSQGYSITSPIEDIPEYLIKIVLNGNEGVELSKGQVSFEGVIPFITRHAEESSAGTKRWAESFMNKIECP